MSFELFTELQENTKPKVKRRDPLLSILEAERKGESSFTSSSDVYFREYELPEESYFEKDKKVLVGQEMPLKMKKGKPKDYTTGKEPEFYTFYTYAKQDNG